MSSERLRVAQLNAGSLLEPGWNERRHEIVAWLEHLGPDIACFQEIWQDGSTPNTAGWIVEQMPDAGWHWHFDGRSFAAQLWPDPALEFGSAVLSRWPIDSGAYHALRSRTGPMPSWPVSRGSCCTSAPRGSTSSPATSPPRRRDSNHRRRQVLAIDEIIAAARGELDVSVTLGQVRDTMPAILCGDFNAEPDSDEIRFLCSLTGLEGRAAFYQDAWRVAGDGPGYTQDWRTNPIAAALNVHRKRIDYVFVGDPFMRRGGAGRILAAQLAFHEPLTGVLASDHAGLVVDIAWPDRPS